MKIGIDIDGVLTDIERYQLDAGSKFFLKYNKNIINNEGYDVNEIFDVSTKLDTTFWSEYLFDYAKNEPARKYAGEVIKKLKEEGSTIIIITARYLANKNTEEGHKMRNIVITWLNDNNIYYDDIIFSSEDKLDVIIKNDVDIMIEDKVDNINKISKKIPVICFNANYNKTCNGENIYRAYSWYDVYYCIKNKINL